MIGLYGRSYDWEIKAIYLFENEENDAEFILYDTTTAGRYIVFLPGSEYGDKVYLIPLYAFSTIAEDAVFGERVGTCVERIMENYTAELAPYDCTKKINDELGISTPAT